MQKNPYLILQTYESATESEIDFAYSRLKSQYSDERFMPGDIGAEAARKLTELEEAYAEVKAKFKQEKLKEDYGGVYGEIENLLKQNKNNDAQAKLDEITDRNAEWHYLQSIVFYKKSWYEESRYQLEMAASMDPLSEKYKDALSRLNVFMSGQAGSRPGEGQNAGQNTGQQYRRPDGQFSQRPEGNYGQDGSNQQRQMGCFGNDATGCCAQLICADCCCECMGGDLILCC